jgi:hypothetical protein
MDVVIRISAVALLATAAALLLRRSNPELSVPLAAAACCIALSVAAVLLRPVRELLGEVEG